MFPRIRSMDERLGAFPAKGLPVKGQVTLRWNTHQVPYILAEKDEDLAFMLGMVHMHLREGQMEVLRRLAAGRISEMAGPLTADIDHALRILDLGKAVPEIEAQLPQETRQFLERFVEGINFYQAHTELAPPEFGLLGIERDPWSVRDILLLSRLAGADVNWFIYTSLLKVEAEDERRTLWVRLLGGSGDISALMGSSQPASLQSLAGSIRAGSNSVVVAPSRSATGSALIANDPHLGLRLPNFWLIVGMSSPSYHAVGLMIPGVPILGVGRNRCIAWGGTNMRAASSDLYEVGDLAPEQITKRQVIIRQRLWGTSKREVRDTEWGPIVSDAEVLGFKYNRPVALRWIGHQVTDEISAFLSATRSCSVDEFRAAFSTFGVSAQNILFATSNGDIGHIRAAILPKREGAQPFPPHSPIRKREEGDAGWAQLQNASDLPLTLNPTEGYIVSANNRPSKDDPVVGMVFSPNDRVDRMRTMIEVKALVGVPDLIELQRDVYSKQAQELAKYFSILLSGPTGESGRIKQALERWDGRYEVDSKGALIFELMLSQVVERMLVALEKPEFKGGYSQWGFLNEYLRSDLEALPEADRRDLVVEAAQKVASMKESDSTWGQVHRLSLGHPLMGIPLLGRFFVEFDAPSAGSRETLMKSAHGFVEGVHDAQFGAQSRHISDLSDPDANYFVLLGGQDGFLGSTTFLDQVPLWERGEFIRMPLTQQVIEQEFDAAIFRY